MWKGKCPVFASRLAAVMARRNISQGDLAKLCAVSKRSVRNWLSGMKPSPTAFQVITMSWGEDTFYYLVGERPTMPEPKEG